MTTKRPHPAGTTHDHAASPAAPPDTSPVASPDSWLATTKDRQLRADLQALERTSRASLLAPEGLASLVLPAQQTTKKGMFMSAKTSRPGRLRLGIAVAAVLLAATGIVYAATQTSLFSIWVDTSGKSDQEVEAEIRDQLAEQGVENADVEFDRQGDGSRLDIAAHQDGKEIRVVHEKRGSDDPGVIQMQPPDFKSWREPGMTDAELEAKIRAHLAERGLDGDVEVHGDEIKVRVHMDREQPSGE